MIHNLEHFANMCKFPTAATQSLLEYEDSLSKNHAEGIFTQCRDFLFQETEDPWQILDDYAEKIGLHPFIVHILFLIYCAPETHLRYQKMGLPDDLYWDSMKDMKYKMEITYNMYGFWGMYCGPWISSFFLLKCFCLGRLQFELLESHFHYELDGCVLKPGDPVINVHIPSFGKLLHEDVLDAYARAAVFFKNTFPDGKFWFHCETWMMYPQVYALIPKGNMTRFVADYDIVSTYIDPTQDDRFRVFPHPPEDPVEIYPENTPLQRDLKAWLLAGNTMGIGHGLMLWKDGGIIHHNITTATDV